ncbi:hypothetical protein Tco_0954921 [Tanacetum coccineum]|uniref:Uncharacterized protein n=1 Tax=Tanacetum coccineum TaxID=301880 RepID=A0ABQ5E5R0_9ASTR
MKEVEILGVSYPSHGEQQCDSLGNYDDLDVYEPQVCYDENEGIYAEEVIFVNKRLVRLMDVTIEKWLDLMYGDYRIVDRSVYDMKCANCSSLPEFRFRDRLYEVKCYRDPTEYDPSNVDFAEWITSKFRNHSNMDWYTKNALWMYWIRGDDEEVLTDNELSGLKETYVNEEDEIDEIFRIETNIFDFKTPLCKAFNEFNYLLKIDTDLLTHDILGFKTYKEYKNAWIHEWYEDVPWVPEEPWLENGVPYKIVDHYCNENMVYFQDYEWYGGLEDGELKDKALMKKVKFEYLETLVHFMPKKSNEEAIKDEREPINDYGVGDSDDHLVSNNAVDYGNEEEE